MVEISQLPPLILHPFSGGGSTEELLEGSRASIALQGFGPRSRDLDDEAELQGRVLIGRYQEIRMLLFLGKDLFRWAYQCVDFVERAGAPGVRVSEQSFAALAVENPPAAVDAKLQSWGVSDRRAIFSRAIGINSLFTSPPPFETVSPLFLQNYHRYADHAYICFQHLRPFQELSPQQFSFELYASEEYSRILSDQWDRA
jgi:hypothetical protein